jgi:hypothetical protein
MTNKQRAARAERALALIDEALAMLEEASWATDVDGGDDLWWAVDYYNDAHHKACETPAYNYKGERLPSHKQAIINAINALKEG